MATTLRFSAFELQPNARLREVTMVQVTTLDELLFSLGIVQVDWVKIDVEGEEIKVLNGGSRFLENAKDLKIIVESSGKQAVGNLERFGFRVEHLGEIYYFAEK